MQKLIILWCLTSWLILSSLIATAQDITIEDMMSNAFPSSLISDPHHDQIAWVINHKGVRNVWHAEAPNFTPRQLTHYAEDLGQSISNLVFSADGGTLYFRKGDGPNRRGEYPNPLSRPNQKNEELSLHSIDLEHGATDEITKGSAIIPSPHGDMTMILRKGKVYLLDLEKEGDGKTVQLFDVRGSISEAHWTYVDGQPHIAFVSNRGDHAFVGIFDMEKKSIQWLSPSVDNDVSIAVSPDGSSIAFLRIPSSRERIPFIPYREAQPWSIMVTDLGTMETTKVWTADEGYGSAWRGISASSQLYWTCTDRLVFPYEKEGYTHLWSIGTDGSQLSNLTPGAHEVQYVTLHADKCSILFSSNQGDADRQHIWSYDFNQDIKTQLSDGQGIEWLPVQSQSGQVYCLASGGKTPAHVARVQDGIVRNIQPSLVHDVYKTNLPIAEQVIFSSPDGMSIHAQLFKPTTFVNGSKHPAILFFHGGSRRQMLLGYHHRGYYHNAYALNQYLASQGYVVLSVNYRSGIGYGLEFREALDYGANGASEYRDVVGGAQYLRSRSDVDADRIGLWGGSYGGYLTALGLAQNSDLFAAGVDIHGVHDWNEVIKNFVPSYNPEKRAAVAKKAYESSPMHFLDGWTSPVLLIHGDDDRNVPFSETVDIVEQLRKRDVYFEQLIFPDEVHGFLLHQNWVDAYLATISFFDRMLKGKK